MNFKSIQTEIDASYLYQILAENEEDETVKEIFTEMSDIEKGHAISFLKNKGLTEKDLPKPSFRARTMNKLGKILGYDFILGSLLETEKNLAKGISNARKNTKTEVSISDTAHVQILQNILNKENKAPSTGFSRFEKRHRSVGGNALRAAVLGANDGLLSTFSLVMGVAGAAVESQTVLLTGIAGLLAGSLSMALGEWISVKSSQELYENQMEIEMEELNENPEGEKREIILIYQAKGIPKDEATEMAEKIMTNKKQAHQFLVKEELGINAEELKGSASEAAFASFFMFAIGAILPVFPYVFWEGNLAVYISAGASVIGLFFIGSVITLFTGKSILYSGFRMVIFGLLAASITFGIGKWIGVSVAG